MKKLLSLSLFCFTAMFIFSCQEDSDLVDSNFDPNIEIVEWDGVEGTYSKNEQPNLTQRITTLSVGSTNTLRMDELPFQPINGLSVGGVNFGFTLNGSPSLEANYRSAGPGPGICWDGTNIEGNANGIMSISFDTPTPSVDFALVMSTGASLSPGFTITYKNTSGVVIDVIPVDTSPLTGSSFTAACYSYESTDCIKSLEIDFNYDGRFAFDNLTYGLSCDSDNDGCPDNSDEHPFSNQEATVTIDGCDSGVSNEFLISTCGSNFMDLILDCAANTKNHGQFVSCVAQLTNGWMKDGLITGAEKAAIQSCAAQANIP